MNRDYVRGSDEKMSEYSDLVNECNSLCTCINEGYYGEEEIMIPVGFHIFFKIESVCSCGGLIYSSSVEALNHSPYCKGLKKFNEKKPFEKIVFIEHKDKRCRIKEYEK